MNPLFVALDPSQMPALVVLNIFSTLQLSLKDFIIDILYWILLISLIALIIWFVVRIYRSQKSISIFPWVNETGDKSFDGFSMGIDDLIMKKLQDIQTQDVTISPKIEAVRDTISGQGDERSEGKVRFQMGSVSRYQTGSIQGGQMGNMQTLGRLSLGPIELPVGLLLTYFTRAFGGKYVKGYLQKYGSTIKIAIHIEKRPSLLNLFSIKRFRKKGTDAEFRPEYGTRYIEHGWQESEFLDSIESVVEDLSYSIYYELSETRLPGDWGAYRHFLKGKELYHLYLQQPDHPDLLQDAERELLEVVRRDARFIDGQYLMGLVAIHFGRYESALLRFEHVIHALSSADKKDDYYQQILLSAYMNVATIYQQIYNNSRKASQLIDRALAGQKECPLSVYLSKADILLNTNQVEEARKILNERSERPQNDQEKQWLNEIRARVHFQLREYEQALEFCNQILESDPENLNAHFYRAYIYTQNNEFAEAGEDYRAILSYNSKREYLLYNYLWYSLRSNNELELHAAMNRYESVFIGFPYIYQPDFFDQFISSVKVSGSEKTVLTKLARMVANQKLSYEVVWKELLNLFKTENNPEKELYLFYGLGVFSFSKNLLDEFVEKLADTSVLFNPPDFSRFYLGFALHYVYLLWMMRELRLETSNKFSEFMQGVLKQVYPNRDIEPLDFIRIELVRLLLHLLADRRGFISQFNLLDVYGLIYDYYTLLPLKQENVEIEAVYEEKIEVLKQKIEILNELGLSRDASDIYVQIADEYESWCRSYAAGTAYYNALLQRAHEALDRAFALDENNYKILGRRSLLFYDQANDVEAIRSGQHSLERQYDQDWVHYNLGMSYKFVQNYPEAEAHLRYAIEFRRKDWRPETSGWDPFFQLAELYREQEKYAESIQVLQDALRHYPLYSLYYRRLAEIYCLNYQYLEGLSELEKVDWNNLPIGDMTLLIKLAVWGLENNEKLEVVGKIATHCENHYLKNKLDDRFLLSQINLLMGWILYFHSNYAEAVKRAEQAEKFLPDDPYVLALKALVLEKYGRFGKSKEEREEYINWSLDYWRDLYLSTHDHIFKKRAENTLRYYRRIG